MPIVTPMHKVLFKVLLKLVRRHGLPLVLQGLIEVARTDKKDPKLQTLANDMEKALQRYRGEQSVKASSVNQVPSVDLQWVDGTKENVVPGARVKNVYNNQEGLVKSVNLEDFNPIVVQDMDEDFTRSWGCFNTFQVALLN